MEILHDIQHDTRHNIKPYSCDSNYTFKCCPTDIAYIADRLIRIAAKATEHYASDILFDIAAFKRAVETGSATDRVLVFHDGGVCSYVVKDGVVSYGAYISAIQCWRLTHDPNTGTVLTRVYLSDGSNVVGM